MKEWVREHFPEPLKQIKERTQEVFRAVAAYYGYSPQTPIPSELVIAGALRPLGPGRVCAAKGHGGPCLITFANEQGTWRLVSFDGDVSLLRLR